jgi:hypothetical protein
VENLFDENWPTSPFDDFDSAVSSCDRVWAGVLFFKFVCEGVSV